MAKPARATPPSRPAPHPRTAPHSRATSPPSDPSVSGDPPTARVAGARDWALVAIVTLVHLATFIQKPAHIDDPLYLETARGILADPLHPLCNAYNWERFERPIYTFAVNPPLYNYQQALLIRLFGWNLPVLHLLSAAYVFLAAAAMLALARRFTRTPLPAFLLLMFAPTVMPQTNLMLDVPCLALVIAAIAAWVRGIDERSGRWLALASLAATAAVLTKYNSLLVLPLLPLYAGFRRQWRAALWALVPLLGLGLWVLHNHFFMPGGAIHLLISSARARTLERVGYLQPILALISWGSGFFFLPALAFWSWTRGRGRRVAIAAALAAAVVAVDLIVTLRPAPIWSVGHYAEHLIFLANGLLLAGFIGVSLLPAGPPRGWIDSVARDDLFLLAWPVGVTAFNLFVAPHHAPRYYFPAYAALPLLLVRALERSRMAPNVARWALWGSVAFQAAIGFTLVTSDNAFARASRSFADRLGALADARQRAITYVGHWGFEYYAQQHARLRCMDVRAPEPPPGTLIAILVDTFEPEVPVWLDGLRPAGEPGVWETVYPGPDGREQHLRFASVEPLWTAPRAAPLVTVGLLDRAHLYASGGGKVPILPYTRATAIFHPMFVLERIP